MAPEASDQLDSDVLAWRRKMAEIAEHATYLADRIEFLAIRTDAAPRVVATMRKYAAELPGVVEALIPLARETGRHGVASEAVDLVLRRYQELVHDNLWLHVGEAPPKAPAAHDRP